MKNPYQIVSIGGLIFGIIPTSAELITINTVVFSNSETYPLDCYAQVMVEDKINGSKNCFLLFLMNNSAQKEKIVFIDTLHGKIKVEFSSHLLSKDLHSKIKLTLINIVTDYYLSVSHNLDLLKDFIADIHLSAGDGDEIDSIDTRKNHISFLHTKNIYPSLVFYKDQHQTILIEHASLQRSCLDQDGVRVHRLNFEIDDTIIGGNSAIWLTTREGLLYSNLHNIETNHS